MPDIQWLEPVGLREVWPHEDHHFTPWLVDQITRLGEKLNLNLEQVEVQKTLPGGAGRVDICARQTETGAVVVIENQLGKSDQSHCLRLLGYAAHAADSGTEILVWVAKEFSPYHQKILKWLNKAETIDVYAVAVQAYRVGKVFIADFQTVVEPSQSRDAAVRSGRKSASTPYAEFYRPLVEQLRREGIRPSSWRGRYRSFHTGFSRVDYGTQIKDGTVQVFLCIGGPRCEDRFNALQQHQKEIDSKVKGRIFWEERSDSWKGYCRIGLENNASFSWTASEEEWEPTRQWMFDNLLLLKDEFEPYLNQLRLEEETVADKED